MNELMMQDKQPRATQTIRVWLLIAVAVAVFIGANAHLIYIATTSQPACVTHLEQGKGDAARGMFSAAQSSSCSPLAPVNPGHS